MVNPAPNLCNENGVTIHAIVVFIHFSLVPIQRNRVEASQDDVSLIVAYICLQRELCITQTINIGQATRICLYRRWKKNEKKGKKKRMLKKRSVNVIPEVQNKINEKRWTFNRPKNALCAEVSQLLIRANHKKLVRKHQEEAPVVYVMRIGAHLQY